MNRKLIWMLLILALSSVQAQTNNDNQSRVGSHLPNHIRSILIEEMQAITDAMSKILKGLVSADHELVAEQAQAIHDSFILAQKMSAEDKQILKSRLPAGFIEKDKAFHQLSAQLAQAAREHNSEQQLNLFQSMQAACMDCHQQHATDRFSQFRQ